MSTFDEFPFDFLTVFIVGGLVCAIAWLFARRLICRSRWWRAVFCILIAATITPTCIHLFDDWVVAPATLIMLLAFHSDNVLMTLLYGALPILAVAGLVFMLWSVVASRRQRREAVA